MLLGQGWSQSLPELLQKWGQTADFWARVEVILALFTCPIVSKSVPDWLKTYIFFGG